MWYSADTNTYRGVAGSISLFALPYQTTSSYSITQVIDDHHGNDYILSTHVNSNYQVDSFFATKFDGSTYARIYLNALGIPVNDTSSIDTFVSTITGMCDYTGALYLNCGHYGLMKYASGSWTHYPTTTFNYLTDNLIVDGSNKLYFLAENSNNIVRFNGSTFDSVALPAPLQNDSSGLFLYLPGPDSSLYALGDTFEYFYRLNADLSWTPLLLNNFQLHMGATGVENAASTLSGYFDRHGLYWMPCNAGSPNVVGIYDPTGFNSISGTVFSDANNNGVQDIGEPGFTISNVSESPDGFVVSPDSTGYYVIDEVDTTVSHTISTTAPLYYHISTASSYTIAPGGVLTGNNFGIAPDSAIQDMSITVCSAYPPFPGDTNIHWLCYQNNGTLTVTDTISYVFDTAYRFVSAVPSPAYVTGHTAKWAYSLTPFGLGNIAVTLVFDTAAQATDSIKSIATVGNVSSDYTPLNNVDTLVEVAVNSYDPNEKTVSPNSNIIQGEALTYTIHFQNTGTAAAQNIVVRDTLDSNLNAASFRLLGSSNPVKYSLKGAGILEFYFYDIMLPDSTTSQAGSHGFVEFMVNVTNNLSSNRGPAVNNQASIYFDYNPPVVTNVATAEFSAVAGILLPGASNSFGLQLMPNPTKDYVTVIVDASVTGGTVQLMDATGRVILNAPYEQQNIQLATAQFSSGLYFVRVIDSAGRSALGKLIIQQ